MKPLMIFFVMMVLLKSPLKPMLDQVKPFYALPRVQTAVMQLHTAQLIVEMEKNLNMKNIKVNT